MYTLLAEKRFYGCVPVFMVVGFEFRLSRAFILNGFCIDGGFDDAR